LKLSATKAGYRFHFAFDSSVDGEAEVDGLESTEQKIKRLCGIRDFSRSDFLITPSESVALLLARRNGFCIRIVAA
jgi:hypothetical protein